MRMKVRFVIGVVAIWIAAVAGVSVTAWLAIDRAGRGVTSATVSALPVAPIATATAATTTGQGASITGPTTQPSASKTTKPSAVAPSPSPSPATAHAVPVPSTPARDRTATVVGGQVSVRCTGSALTLRIAQPDNGWRVELDRSDSGDAQVTFKGADGEASQESQVKATCVSGTPVFKVESGSSPDS